MMQCDYFILTALAGRHAIWKSTATIETIVERELLKAAEYFRDRDQEVYDAINKTLLDELQHKELGETHANYPSSLDPLVISAATVSASVSKKLAEKI